MVMGENAETGKDIGPHFLEDGYGIIPAAIIHKNNFSFWQML